MLQGHDKRKVANRLGLGHVWLLIIFDGFKMSTYFFEISRISIEMAPLFSVYRV